MLRLFKSDSQNLAEKILDSVLIKFTEKRIQYKSEFHKDAGWILKSEYYTFLPEYEKAYKHLVKTLRKVLEDNLDCSDYEKLDKADKTKVFNMLVKGTFQVLDSNFYLEIHGGYVDDKKRIDTSKYAVKLDPYKKTQLESFLNTELKPGFEEAANIIKESKRFVVR